MKISGIYKKNFVIFSLVLMLGLIGYINYSLNRQSLLQTSSDLEKYELMMMSRVEDENSIDEEESDISLIFDDEDDYDSIIVDSLRESNIVDVARETNAQITSMITNRQMMKSNEYFIRGRIERDKRRSEMISYLNNIINNQHTTDSLRDQAVGMKIQIISNTDSEMMIESMIIAKGFSDAIVYLTDSSINIVVHSEGLVEREVAQIVDIVRRKTNIPMDNIVIMHRR